MTIMNCIISITMCVSSVSTSTSTSNTKKEIKRN